MWCRDFSNGFLVAEIFSKYFSTEIAMHSFDATATNADRKRDNWTLLEKFCKVRDPGEEAKCPQS